MIHFHCPWLQNFVLDMGYTLFYGYILIFMLTFDVAFQIISLFMSAYPVNSNGKRKNCLSTVEYPVANSAIK